MFIDCLQIEIIMQITSNNKELIKILFLLHLLLSVTANGIFLVFVFTFNDEATSFLVSM